MSFFHIETNPATLDVSIVIPVYNERPNIGPLAAEIAESMRATPRRIVEKD